MSTIPSFLIIGATGRTGLHLLRAIAAHDSHPPAHAFARSPSKFQTADSALCTTIQQGDATVLADIESALRTTKADVVIVAIGVANSTAKTDLRARPASALYEAVSKKEFDTVRVVVISAVGAGGSVIDVGWGIGQLVGWVLRDVMKDHDKQEEILGALGERVMIVRPMGLGEGKEAGGVQEFLDERRG